MRTSLSSVVLAASLFACSPPPSPGDEALLSPPAIERDAGAVAPDAGTPVIDAGAAQPQPDAGAPGAIDAGAPVVVDAGTTPSPIDVTPPRVTVAARLQPSTLRVSGTVSDLESGVISVELRLNGGTPMSVPALDGGYDVELPLRPGRAEYTVEATARDQSRNAATAQVTVDGEAPAITLSPSQDGACTSTGCTGALIDTRTSSFTLTATVTEGLGLAAQDPVRARVLDGATEVVSWTRLTRQATGEWTWTWSALPNLDFTRLTVEVEATDAANNRGIARLQVVMDRLSPALQLTPSTDAACTATACTGTVLNLASPGLPLTGTVSPDASVQVSVLDGTSVLVPAQAAMVTNGAWSFTWSNLPNVDGRPYTVVVTATDALLNTTTRQLTVFVDRVLPTLVVSSPISSALVGTAKVDVSATSLDGAGLTRVDLATSPQGPFVTATRNAAGLFAGQLDVPVVDAVAQELTVRATDLAGNARTATVRYVADRVAPVLTLNGSDFDCSGPDFCTGSVVMGASIRHNYGGAVTDGSTVTVQRTLVSPSAVVASSLSAATGNTWAWSWSNFPQGVDGAVYELRVVATDAAGNSSAQLTRRTWVDTVGPTVTLPVAGQRNVALDATLAVFSEPMSTSSVVSAVSISPAVNPALFASTDGRSFKFPANQLLGYTPYALTLGAAQDKAGNLSQPASASFLTAVTALPNHHVFPGTDGWQPRSPRVTVDQDGRFSIAVTANARLRVLRDRGDGSQDTGASFGNVADLEVPTDFTLTRQVRGADQRLVVEHQLGSIFTAGGVSSLSRITLPDGAPISIQALGATAAMSLSTSTTIRPAFELVPYFDLFTRRVQTFGAVIAPNNGATAMSWWSESQGAWSAGASSALTSLRSFQGRASIESVSALQARVRFWDFDSVSLVTTGSSIRSATAQPARKSASSLSGTQAASSSYVAWTTDQALVVSCSAAPFAAAPIWRSTQVGILASQANTPISSAMSATKFVVAGEYGGQVIVYSTPLTDCASAPVLTEVGRIPNAREPGVTIDETGKVWVAWLNADGAIGLSRF